MLLKGNQYTLRSDERGVNSSCFWSTHHFIRSQILWSGKKTQTIHTMRHVRCDKEHVISQSESVALNEDNFTCSPPSGIGDDFGYPVLSALVFLNFLALSIFWHWAYLMKDVPETCRMLFYYTLYLTSVLCSYATLKEQCSGKVEIIWKNKLEEKSKRRTYTIWPSICYVISLNSSWKLKNGWLTAEIPWIWNEN